MLLQVSYMILRLDPADLVIHTMILEHFNTYSLKAIDRI